MSLFGNEEERNFGKGLVRTTVVFVLGLLVGRGGSFFRLESLELPPSLVGTVFDTSGFFKDSDNEEFVTMILVVAFPADSLVDFSLIEEVLTECSDFTELSGEGDFCFLGLGILASF